ncbi:17159_t:CDS:10 [Dentiscutata erythropus]|uniref:ubiquitinyl hydrolase 1 n=1 Tax=Dentiscutata erythropus TaxID=1348616 RepID=A0A9N9B8G5_9GLOM|nr:17159_t:CDS:10 [Dentiscutata erythropus]
MPPVKVNVKWKGKNYEVELDTDASASDFKAQLFSMTEVEPSRQKIMIKGGILKDDTDLKTLNIKEGASIMLPKEPAKKTLFIEDMTDRQLAETVSQLIFLSHIFITQLILMLISRLKNLGNTCYMNATLQCLRTIPELQESLNRFPNSVTSPDLQITLTTSLRDLYKQLNRTTESYVPFTFLQALRSAFPQFDQRNANGYMQQDAEECWTQIVTSLNNANIPVHRLQDGSTSSEGSTSSSSNDYFVKHQIINLIISLKCVDAPDEPESTTHSTFTKLSCITSEKDLNYMQSGILMALDENIEKDSPSLGHIANYTKISRISRLPSYLTVGFVRFWWKNNRQIRTKITRRVQFPFDYDAYDLCTDELKQKIGPLRAHILEREKEKDSAKRKAKLSVNSNEKETAESKNDSNVSEVDEEVKKLIDPDLEKDIGANVSGLYELCAVLTHIGRSADSGHYIGWARKHDSPEEWVKYDDDKVSIVPQSEIQKLDGGGGSAY